MSWTLDTTHSNVGFTVRHMMFTKVRGQFTAYEGQVEVDPADPASLKVVGVVQAASIDTNDDQRDGHLKSGDFFDVETFPTLRFESTSVQAKGSEVTVVGDLTIRDVTRSVTLTGSVQGPAKDPWGNQRVSVSMSGAIQREDWGLGWNQVLEAGGVLVGKEVQIDVELQAIQQG